MSTASTVGDWLASRTPPPPDLLQSRILSALGASAAQDVADTERACLEAAERVLTRLFDDGIAGRPDAADLLAADALVTYALEFAADAPASFAEQAASAMLRFGTLPAATP
ncbi:MAG: hypothetical protein ACT4PJ_05870 [Gemmatimonadaceae bacterium]